VGWDLADPAKFSFSKLGEFGHLDRIEEIRQSKATACAFVKYPIFYRSEIMGPSGVPTCVKLKLDPGFVLGNDAGMGIPVPSGRPMGGFVPERSVFSDQLLLNGIKWLRPPFSIVEENLKHVLNGICQRPGDRNVGENKPDISTGIGFRETGFKSPGQGIILIGKRINLGFSGFF
jgi:hypothetical protein